MTANLQANGGFFCAPEEYWSKARLNLNDNTAGIHLIFPVNGQDMSSLYLIPVGNAEHPDLQINSCWYMAIAAKGENGTIMYLKFQADPASGTGRALLTSEPDLHCVFLKARTNLIDGNRATTITFMDDGQTAMHLHYDTARDIMVFKKECVGTSEREMYWLPNFEVAIRGAPPTTRMSFCRIFVEEVVREVRSEIIMEAGWWLLSTLLGV